MSKKVDTFRAFKSDVDEKWGIEDLYGAILYEPCFDSEGIASYVALRHTQDVELTWEDIQADVEKLEAEAPAAPTPDVGAHEPSAFAQAAQGDDRLAVTLYSEAVLETRVKELEAENALYAEFIGEVRWVYDNRSPHERNDFIRGALKRLDSKLEAATPPASDTEGGA